MTSFTICPACNYTRKPSDDALDWECPNCHKAYIKTARKVQHQEAESLPFTLGLSSYQKIRMKYKYKSSAIPAMIYLMVSLASLLFVFVSRNSLAGVGVAILTTPWSLIGVALIDSMHKLMPTLNSMNILDHIFRICVAAVGITINAILLLLLFGYFKKSN